MNKLAKTSQKPGKTRLINYFRINGDFYIVDLPGYGFAQASKQEQAQWGELIESYLASGRVKHIFMLVDIRHEPTRDDKQMFKYILYYAIPYTLIATKADKLAKTRRKQAAVARARDEAAFRLRYEIQGGHPQARIYVSSGFFYRFRVGGV